MKRSFQAPKRFFEMRLWLPDLMRLPEYSTTLPTGMCDGKTWRCAARFILDGVHDSGWVVFQYHDLPGRPHLIGIRGFHVTLRQGPLRGDERPQLFKVSCL